MSTQMSVGPEQTKAATSQSTSADIDDLLRRRDSHFSIAARWAFWLTISLLVLEIFAFSYAITPNALSGSLTSVIAMFFLIGGLQFVFLVALIWAGRILWYR